MHREILTRLKPLLEGAQLVEFQDQWCLFFSRQGVECSVFERPDGQAEEASHQGSVALVRDNLMEKLLADGHMLVMKSGPLPDLRAWLGLAEQVLVSKKPGPYIIVAEMGGLHFF